MFSSMFGNGLDYQMDPVGDEGIYIIMGIAVSDINGLSKLNLI